MEAISEHVSTEKEAPQASTGPGGGAAGMEMESAAVAFRPAARALGTVEISRSANTATRAAVMRRAQQAHGNRFVQGLVATAARVQRTCACGGTCDACRGKPVEQGSVSPAGEGERRVQTKLARAEAGREGPLEASIPTGSAGQPLDRETRGAMESGFGENFSDVRVHTGAIANQSAEALDAQAFTFGRDIYFGAGRYQPSNREGRRLLAHELTHTIQQSRAPALSPAEWVPVSSPRDPEEVEAERAADAVVEEGRPPVEPGTVSVKTAPNGSPPTPGNQLTQGLFAEGIVRAKLDVGAPDDPEEREADALAQTVMSGPASCSCAQGVSPCPKCAAKSQHVLRRKAQSGATVGPVSLEANLSLGAGRALRDSERSFHEPRLGGDLSAVRLHDGGDAAAVAQSIQARAFSFEHHIGLAAGAPDTESPEGRRLLAHELAHVVLNHSRVRRMSDAQAENWAEAVERLRREQEERERHHQAWSGAVESQFGRDLSNQSHTAGEEHERIELALVAQRGQALDAVAGGQGWLRDALKNRGYSGPDLIQVRQLWADAIVAAETVKASVSAGTVTPEARLTALSAIPAFYDAAGPFAKAAEEAHRDWAQQENARRQAAYQSQLAEYNRGERLDQMAQGPIGEPGERAFRASQAIVRGSPPERPAQLNPPLGISAEVAPANSRVYVADSSAEWLTVGTDLNRIANGVTTLVVASLPGTSEVRLGLEHLEGLNTRLAAIEQASPNAVRIPAVFYPDDRVVKQSEQGGQDKILAEAIPWQFYLINTGVTNPDQPARSGGEWVLIDLTSSQRFENRAPASDLDSAMLQQGAAVDPPISMFGELNSRIRFPEGRLYFTLPSGKSYVLKTTEPWSLSDWLTAVGIALAAIALVASLIATGGASAPAAVAFYAGLGAAAAGVGSTLANLHEKSVQGILTSKDVDEAMISIGIDLLTAASMGLGRLVALPEAAARIGLTGERFIALQRVTQVARAAVVVSDVYQAWSFTSGVISALRAIDAQPNLSAAERNRMRAQIVRQALLTGALLTVALKGDIQEFRAGGGLRVSHVDPDGALVAVHEGEPVAHEHEPGNADSAAAAAHAAPHGEVSGPVHAGSERNGTGVTLGAESHAVAAGGTGPHRDFYLCSDLCAPIVNRLESVLAVLPREHPMRAAVQDMLSRARAASRNLKSGKLTQEAADTVARELRDRLGRLGADSQHFNALMNTDPAILAAHAPEIRQRLADVIEHQTAMLAGHDERQAGAAAGRDRDPLVEPDPHSSLETDLLGGVAIHEAKRPGGRAQPLHFDTGNFSHTHAEALVPGLPRGLEAEVTVTRLDGSVGRADRVRFIYDADGDRIGAHVFEIKPNTPENITRGERQVQEYVDGLRAEIEENLRAAGKAVPATAPGGGPLYDGRVMTYNQEQMLAVMRAVRGGRVDPARMAEYEAVARQVFGVAPVP